MNAFMKRYHEEMAKAAAIREAAKIPTPMIELEHLDNISYEIPKKIYRENSEIEDFSEGSFGL